MVRPYLRNEIYDHEKFSVESSSEELIYTNR